ncbi:cysteine-rich secretory protein 2-like [Harmonia axyridis]|uniref:cysteine-rich secretory protein 2-like n=1 Tax=Harmonia axyridis TaxID=115357 RepID=UPI001E279161|nr:cysteine-rich secretory protein 2-like [Harmonia axyridis]
MQFILFISLFWFTYVSSKFKKPSFSPYCLTRSLCKSACNCSATPNCTLLDLNKDFREKITFYINQIREIQTRAEPQPSGLRMLEYDEQLEELSSCWVSKCEIEYSDCFYSPRYSVTSQTVGYSTRKEPSLNLWYEIINTWLDEIRKLNVDMLLSFPAGEKGLNIHNFAQLLSDKVCHVGCSWSVSPNFVLLVCTFGPSGPLQSQPIYKTGIPCSGCPPGYECDKEKPFEHLCKNNHQRSSSSRLSSLAKNYISSRDTKAPGNKKKDNKKNTFANNPLAGIYFGLILLLGAVVVIFILGFACYCICCV